MQITLKQGYLCASWTARPVTVRSWFWFAWDYYCGVDTRLRGFRICGLQLQYVQHIDHNRCAFCSTPVPPHNTPYVTNTPSGPKAVCQKCGEARRK